MESYSPSVYWKDLALADLMAMSNEPQPGLSGCGSTRGCYRTPPHCVGPQVHSQLLYIDPHDTLNHFAGPRVHSKNI